MNEKTTITGYKGFDKNLQCRGFQYEVGKEYETDEVKLCQKGFHFCENPHDVLRFYSAGEGNRFAIVEASDVSDEKGNEDSKRVAKRIKVKAEISVFEICKIAVSAFFENFGFKKKIESADTNNAGDKGAANAGDYGAANAGDYGAANAGDYGAANAGNCGAANAGDYGAANAGNCGAANAGDYGAAIVSNNGRVKGGYGCVLVARNIEWNDNNNRYEVTDWSCGIVDGVNLKEDTWYKLENGKLVEADAEKSDQ